jgi:hypothetical protein
MVAPQQVVKERKGELVDLRPPRDEGGIDPERHQRGREHDVAPVEADACERREIAVQDDDEHAEQRDRDAGELRTRQPHAEQHQRPQRHEQRSGRLDQQRVQCLRILHRPVRNCVVEGKAYQ